MKTVEARVKWTGEGIQLAGRTQNGPGIIMDNHEGGSGPGPMDLVLMGIAGCTSMDVISILKKKRSPFTGFHVDITGDRAEDHPKRYQQIHMEFVVTGTGVKPRDVERSIELSVTKYCSAVATINADITHSYRIVSPEP
jgi:putative redox protein